ncbi:MAG: T9SS type A sorting domain-containing protein [Chitinophagaceae bacterium]|nr:T9SS type A sorting domain-containing protein [Chitinophagaceae bacterium]
MKIFYTLSIILFISVTAKSQDRTTPSPAGDPTTKIIKFYPNPAVSFINFEFQKAYDKSYNFQIFNFLGKKVFEVNNVTPKTVVSVADFFRGVYIFQLRDKNGKVVDSGKFQVSK